MLNDEIGIPDRLEFSRPRGNIPDRRGELCSDGWMAHQVRVDPASEHFLGARKIGSSIAEREALTWAMLWRIGFNSTVPTVFHTDSQLTLQQATGEIEAAECDMSSQLLRDSYQLLEAALPHGDLLLEHVYGHSGDPFNEFCDITAKAEAQRSFYLPWIDFPIANWKQLVPYLWTLFDQQVGVPFNALGFQFHLQKLPCEHTPSTCPLKQVQQKTIQFSLSIASANVLSMSRGDEGHGGKLHYL